MSRLFDTNHFGSSFLALLAPAMIDSVTAGRAASPIRTSKNCAIFIIGLIGFTTGTYASISNIIQYFLHPEQ